MAKQAREAIGGGDLTVIADQGYFKGEEILACQEAGITAIGCHADPVGSNRR